MPNPATAFCHSFVPGRIDAFAVRVTDALSAPLPGATRQIHAPAHEIDYARYARLRGKLTL